MVLLIQVEMVRMVHRREEKEDSDLISVGTKSETDNRGPGVATWVVQRLHRDATWTIPTIQNRRAPRAVGEENDSGSGSTRAGLGGAGPTASILAWSVGGNLSGRGVINYF